MKKERTLSNHKEQARNEERGCSSFGGAVWPVLLCMSCMVCFVSGQGCYNANTFTRTECSVVSGNYRNALIYKANGTSDECKQACKDNCKCLQYVWWGYGCSLYAANTILGSGAGGWVTGNKTSDACGGVAATYTSYPGQDMSVDDLDTLTDSVTSGFCQDRCTKRCDCAAFTIADDNAGRPVCHLKGQVGGQRADASSSLWIRDGGCGGLGVEYTEYTNSNVIGDDINEVTDIDQLTCQAACNANCNCKAYAYNTTEQRCSLKNALADTNTLQSVTLYVQKGANISTTPQASPAPAPAPAPPPPPAPAPAPAPAPTLAPAAAQSQEAARSHHANLAIVLPVAALAVLALLAGFAIVVIRRRRRSGKAPLPHSRFHNSPQGYEGLRTYSYARLQAATSDFQDVLGRGGSAEVFRGELQGREVAIKKLKEASDRKRSEREFASEAEGLGILLHKNVVRLLGYSAEPDCPKLLVYEFIHGGSLQGLLYGTKEGVRERNVTFERRMAIALGIARGIEYCHHSIEPPIIHRDIKPANILMTSLDNDGVPKVADFGLSRIIDAVEHKGNTRVSQVKETAVQDETGSTASAQNSTIVDISPEESSLTSSSNWTSSSEVLKMPSTTRLLPGAATTDVAGTFGYLDPEYLRTCRPTLKSDVYSLGVLLLELMTGVTPFELFNILIRLGKVNYEQWLGDLITEGEDAIVSTLGSILGQSDLKSTTYCQAASIAHQCLREKGKLRPSMRTVVRLLEQITEG